MNPARRLTPRLPERGEVIWINPNPQAGRERKNPHPFRCFRLPHPMGLLSDAQLALVLEIVGQILGFVA